MPFWGVLMCLRVIFLLPYSQHAPVKYGHVTQKSAKNTTAVHFLCVFEAASRAFFLMQLKRNWLVGIVPKDLTTCGLPRIYCCRAAARWQIIGTWSDDSGSGERAGGDLLLLWVETAGANPWVHRTRCLPRPADRSGDRQNSSLWWEYTDPVFLLQRNIDLYLVPAKAPPPHS